MGWFGIGARIGVTQLRLTAPTSVVNDIEQVTGGSSSADEFALRRNVTTLTPTIHLGGRGYFFKLDLPISFGSSFSMVGLGLYPINYGICLIASRCSLICLGPWPTSSPGRTRPIPAPRTS